MKSLTLEDLNEVVFKLNPSAEKDGYVKYCFMANLLWLTMTEKQQQTFLKEMKKQIAQKGL